MWWICLQSNLKGILGFKLQISGENIGDNNDRSNHTKNNPKLKNYNFCLHKNFKISVQVVFYNGSLRISKWGDG